MGGLQITSATSAERAAIEELLGACALPTSDVAQHLANFFVARSGDALAGVVGLQPAGRYALLRSLAVAPRFRLRGIAGALCERAAAHAAAQGAETLYLLTTTAQRYFAAAGFAVVQRDAVPGAIRSTAEFSALCPDTAVVMAKQLKRAAGTPG